MKDLPINGTFTCVVAGVWVCVCRSYCKFQEGFSHFPFRLDVKCSTKEHEKSKFVLFASLSLFLCRQMDDANPSLRRCGVTDDREIHTAGEKVRGNHKKRHSRL